MTWIYLIFLLLFLILSALLTFVIIIQESKSAGMASIFGADTSDSLFGVSTPEVLRKFTAYLAAVFMISCIVLSIWTSALGRPKPFPETEIEEVQTP